MITATQVDDLNAAIRLWATRDHNAPTAAIRQAATDITAGIDAIFFDLGLLRTHTVSEGIEYDDLVAAHEPVWLAEVSKP